MATLDVLEGVRDVVALANGVVSSYRGIPRLAPDESKLPAAITRWNVDAVAETNLGTEEWWMWPVRVDLLIAKGDDLWAIESTALPFVEAMMAAIRGHVSFFDSGILAGPIQWQPRLIAIWDEIYVAITFQFPVENHFERGGSVAP